MNVKHHPYNKNEGQNRCQNSLQGFLQRIAQRIHIIGHTTEYIPKSMIIKITHRQPLNLFLQSIADITHGLLQHPRQKNSRDQLRNCFDDINNHQRPHDSENHIKMDMCTFHALQYRFPVTKELCCHLSLHHRHHRKCYIGHDNHQQTKDQAAFIRTQKIHQIFEAVTHLGKSLPAVFIFSSINRHSAVPPHSAEMLQFHSKAGMFLIIPHGGPMLPDAPHPEQGSDPHP